MAGKQVQHEVLSNPLISPFKIPKTCTAEQLNSGASIQCQSRLPGNRQIILYVISNQTNAQVNAYVNLLHIYLITASNIMLRIPISRVPRIA